MSDLRVVGAGAMALFLVADVARAAAPPVSDEVVVERVDELNESAKSKIALQRFDGARKHLLDAERMAKERGGVVAGTVLAPTYLYLGAVEVMTGGDAERAKNYFRRALCRRPRIRPDEASNYPEVVKAFNAARADFDGPPPACRLLSRLQAQARHAREADLPARVQALDCPNPDEALAGADFVVRCAVAERLPVARVTLRYRPPGTDAYAAVEMARTARGWWTAAIPAKDVAGTSVPYFFEGKNAAGKLVVANGEANSPNFALIISADRCNCD